MMISHRCLALAVMLLALPPAARAQTEPPAERVAVAALSGLGVDPEVMARLEDYLRGEISRIPGFTVLSRRDQEERLRGQLAGLADTRGDPKRMAKLAAALEARFAVQGTVATFGERIQFNVKVLDTRPPPAKKGKRGPSLREESGSLTGSGDQLIPGIRLIAHQLFAPGLITGYLALAVPLDGVSVVLDGATLGTTPFDKPVPVAPGAHTIVLRRAGYTDATVSVTTQAFQTTVVNATPSEAP